MIVNIKPRCIYSDYGACWHQTEIYIKTLSDIGIILDTNAGRFPLQPCDGEIYKHIPLFVARAQKQDYTKIITQQNSQDAINDKT